MFKNRLINRHVFLMLLVTGLFTSALQSELIINEDDREFAEYVRREIKKMEAGKRGLVSQTLIKTLNNASLSTTITPLTRDDATWHPNDRKGLRSHVEAVDFKVRGAARTKPTKAIVYLHISRINPKLSTFKLGTFVHHLSEALDLNQGEFSGDHQVREKRASFYRNAWRDALGYPTVEMSGHIIVNEYQKSKEFGLITEENKSLFPILNPWHLSGKFEDISGSNELVVLLSNPEEQKIYYGDFSKGSSFLKIVGVNEKKVRVRFGQEERGQFEIYEANLDRSLMTLSLPITKEGLKTGQYRFGCCFHFIWILEKIGRKLF